MFQTRQQGFLTASRYHDNLKSLCAHLFEQLFCARHLRRFLGIGIEQPALFLVNLMFLFRSGRSPPKSLRKNIYRAVSSAPFVHVRLFVSDVKPEFAAHLCPRLCMAGHGIEQNAVHVKQHGFKVQSLKAVVAEIFVKLLFIHDYSLSRRARMASLSFS